MEKEEHYDVTLLGFTLRKRGMQMEYHIMQPKRRGGMQMMVETKEKSPFPPSSKILRLVDGIKVYACMGLGLWSSSFSKFTDDDGSLKEFSDSMFGDAYREMRDTLDSVEILSIIFDGGYKFLCQVETLPGKRVKMRTPLISDGDDLYELMYGRMQELGRVSLDFISSAEYDVRAEARSIAERTMSKEEIEGKTDQEVLLIAMNRIEELGGVVMYSEELEAELKQAREDEPLLSVLGSDAIDESDVKAQEVIAWAKDDRGYDDEQVESEEDDEVIEVIERKSVHSEWEDDGDRSPTFDADEEDRINGDDSDLSVEAMADDPEEFL